ncbi:hypothetical protein H2199_007813 [Coniosporium tulheliwenetii]|uniref:Uncharacterized protein n=1 Tax=Coniosporium tulheliwenetii TaxID=3383036 RepID=A0ACC2YN68_9PEZI|nr:hypothetical protein H2199_007813 [Cladosporium sp. JES 115]
MIEGSSSTAPATRQHFPHSGERDTSDMREGNVRMITSPETEATVGGDTLLARPMDAEFRPSFGDEAHITDEGIWIPKGYDSTLSAGYWTENYGDDSGSGPTVVGTGLPLSAFLVVTPHVLPPKNVMLSSWLAREVKLYSSLPNTQLNQNWPARFDSGGNIKLSRPALGHPAIGVDAQGRSRYHPKIGLYRRHAGVWTFSTYPARPEEEISPFDDYDRRLYANDNVLRKALAGAEKAGRVYRIPTAAHSDATSVQSATYAGTKHSLKRPATALPDVGRSAAQRARNGKRLRQNTSKVPSQEKLTNKDHSLRIAKEAVSKFRGASGLTDNERKLLDYVKLLEDENAALHKANSQSNAALSNAQEELQAKNRATNTGMEDAILAAKSALRNLEDTALFFQSSNTEGLLSRALVTTEDSLTEAGFLETAGNLASLGKSYKPTNQWVDSHATHPEGPLAGLEEFTKEQLREVESDG